MGMGKERFRFRGCVKKRERELFDKAFFSLASRKSRKYPNMQHSQPPISSSIREFLVRL